MTQERLPLKIKNFPQRLQILQTSVHCTSKYGRHQNSFGTMKIVKNYLRSTMKDERLADLIVLSTGKDLTHMIDLDSVLESWSTRKNRKLKIRFK